jgi:hypothetical protein
VHFGRDSLSLFECCADGIAGISAPIGLPFVFAQSLEIIGVNDGVFVLCQGYSPEWVTVTELSVQEQPGYKGPCKPVRNRDGEIELYYPLRPECVKKLREFEILSAKSETTSNFQN